MNKRLLAVAVGAIASSSALATPVINDSVANVFATESLNATTPTVAGINVQLNALGTGVTTSDQLFVRMDLSGGIKTVNQPILTATANYGSITVAQGGANSAYTIFSLTATANAPQTDGANISMNGPLSVPGTNAVSTVTVCTYDSLSGAVNQVGSLGCDTHAKYLSFVTGVAVTADANTLVADVAYDFKKFSGNAVTGLLGEHGVAAAGNVNAPVLDAATGAQVAIANIVNLNNSLVTYAGDFSVGNFFIAAANDCVTGPLIDLAEKNNNVVKASITANLGSAVNTPAGAVNGGSLCVTENGTTAIPVAEYTVAIDLVGVTGKVAPGDVGATPFGSIVRNGTEIKVEYLSTFSSYNQRIVLTNRGGRDYAYAFTFSTEDGVTAAAGPKATGVVPAGETLVIKTTDVVTFTGGTRGSGVITIPAVQGTVTGAVTQVNLSDGGTDTTYIQ